LYIYIYIYIYIYDFPTKIQTTLKYTCTNQQVVQCAALPY